MPTVGLSVKTGGFGYQHWLLGSSNFVIHMSLQKKGRAGCLRNQSLWIVPGCLGSSSSYCISLLPASSVTTQMVNTHAQVSPMSPLPPKALLLL